MVVAGGSALTLGLNPTVNGEMQLHPHPPAQGCVSDQEVSQDDDDSQGLVEAGDQANPAGRENHARKRRHRRLDVAQWTDPAVKVLIYSLRLLRISSGMYDDDLVDKETGRRPSRSNKQIWKLVASAMRVLGHNFDAGQCKTKFKGLKSEYSTTAQNLGFSGGSHAAVPGNWEEISNASKENREKTHKFKFFGDMRGYFAGSPVPSPESLFSAEKAEEFTKILETVKHDLDLGRREGLDKEKCRINKGLAADCQGTGRSEGNFLKRNSVRVIDKPPVPQPVWTTNHLTDESLHQEETDVQELQASFEDTRKRKDLTVEKEAELKEEYRAKKLQLKYRQLQLAEKIYDLQVRKVEQEEQQLRLEENNYQLQVRKAEHEMQHSTRKLELETRQLDMEERRLKQQEEHFMILQANSRTKNFPSAES